MVSEFVVFSLLLAGIIILIAFASEILNRVTRIPNIVFYLIFALILGPLGLRLLHPGIIIPNLELFDLIISMALALVIFEGGYSFNRCFAPITNEGMKIQMKECKPISLRLLLPRILRLVVIGGAITASLTAFLFLSLAGFPFELAILCGVLCAITGPTVINPILRELEVKEEVAETLQGEGEFNDGIFAVIAAVIFSAILLELSGFGAVIIIPLQIAIFLILGFLVGVIIGLIGIGFTKYIEPKIINYGGTRINPSIWTAIEQMGLLCVAFLAYGIGSLIGFEAAILSTLIAGLLLGQRHRFQKDPAKTTIEENETEIIEAEIHSFQLPLTNIAIATIFILALAFVDLGLIMHLITFQVIFVGLILVIALILVVRPIGVLLSTIRSDFTLRERAFMSFFAPRGVIIAALGFSFALEFIIEGYYISWGELMLFYIFLIVFISVLLQGGLAPYIAKRMLTEKKDTQES
ncbi:MAG: cation:proton antiporter [Candidatus Thorarchaeota archaeon]